MIPPRPLATSPPPRLPDLPYFEELREGFTRLPTTESFQNLGLYFVVALLLVFLVYRWYTHRGGRRPARAATDYLTLAVDLLGLTEEQRRDLINVARRSRIPHPAAMLLAPACLRQAVAAASAARRDEALRARILRLEPLLFGQAPSDGRAPAVVAPGRPVNESIPPGPPPGG